MSVHTGEGSDRLKFGLGLVKVDMFWLLIVGFLCVLMCYFAWLALTVSIYAVCFHFLWNNNVMILLQKDLWHVVVGSSDPSLV